MHDQEYPSIPEQERIALLENPGRDYPFYRGEPVLLTGKQWGVVLLLVALAFAILIASIPWPFGAFGQLVPALLFPAIPLAGLAIASRGHAGSLFGPVGAKEIRYMFLFALLNVVVSMAVGGVVNAIFSTSPNSAVSTMSGLGTGELVLFFLKTIPQLFGEELLTVLPFLALMYFFVSKLQMERKPAVLLAWVISAILFGSVHLSTYDWNVAQCLLVIGSARLVLTLAYFRTRNILVSTGAHVINDWVLFVMNIVGMKMLGP